MKQAGGEWFKGGDWESSQDRFLAGGGGFVAEEGGPEDEFWSRVRDVFKREGWPAERRERMERWVRRFRYFLGSRGYAQTTAEDVEHFLAEARRAGINERAVSVGADALGRFFRGMFGADWAERFIQKSEKKGRGGNSMERPALAAETVAERYAGRTDTEKVPERARPFLEEVRMVLRRGHYAARTEETYVNWVERFLAFARPRDRGAIAVGMVQEYLEYLAVVRKVSARTQNQALNALVYLFREVWSGIWGKSAG